MFTYESYAEYYHDLTKYSPEGIANHAHRIDFNKQPIPYKDYPNKKHIDLSYLLPLDRNPFNDIGIKNPEDFSPIEKSLSKISKLLYLTNGITAVIPTDKPMYLRAAPSAGGLYPTEIYLFSNSYLGLEDGVYNYQVRTHSLVKISNENIKEEIKKSTFNNSIFEKNKLTLVFTGIFFRSSWRYQDRAYRRICLDTGHVLGNLIIASYSCGFKVIPTAGFIDKNINDLLFLNEEEEQSLVLVSLLDSEDITEINFPLALPSKLDNSSIKTPEGHRLIELHNRSKIDKEIKLPNIKIENVEEKFILSPSIQLSPALNDFNWKNNILQTILNRRSTRAFSGEALTKQELSNILDFTYHGDFFASEGLDPNPCFFDLSLLETFIAVNNVQGIEEGCYFYSPKGRYLRQVRFKNFKEDIFYLCLGQELGLKASAVIFHTCNLSQAIYKYGERAYRYMHLDAGHLGERINLAAINLDLGVSGIGGFFDDQVNELLGIPENEAVVYITTLGIPTVGA